LAPAARSSSPLDPASKASAATTSAAAASQRTRMQSNAPLAPTPLPGSRPAFARARLVRGAAAALVACLSTGCYLGHLAGGQSRLLLGRQPVEDVLARPATPPALAARLRLAGEVRRFAERLGLAVGRQYTSYVDWPGDRVLTTVVAARPGAIDPHGFWFPIVGRVPYKGFFDPELAEREAARLRQDGLDTCVVPVLAYSTLGWLGDPITAPLARLGESRFAETLLHELLHATVYVGGESQFNEGLATFVGQEAVVRFFTERDGLEAGARERLRVEEDRRVAEVLLAFRGRVRALYAREAAGPARDAARAALEQEARDDLAALPLQTRDPLRVAEAARLSDACQALAGTYQSDLAQYDAVLARLDGDLTRFVAEARRVERARHPRTVLFALAR